MPYVTVDIDVELDQFDDEDIREYAEQRGLFDEHTRNDLVEPLYHAYMLKSPQFDQMLKDFFYASIGRIA
jgi:hypothetical protein